MRFAIGGIVLLMIAATVIITPIATIIYLNFYRNRINKQLHDATAKPRRLLSPLAFSITVILSVLIVFAGVTSFLVLTDYGADIVPGEYRNAIYDYRSFNPHEMTGYRSNYSINDNPGYTKSIEQYGDIRFTCFVRNEAFDYYHPSFIIYAEYTGDEDDLHYGVQGEFYAPDDIQMTGKYKDYICIIGTSTIQSRFELSIYFFDSGVKGEWRPEDNADWVIAGETFTVVIPIP